MKGERLVIRCKPETRRAFKLFVAENEFKNYEDALLFLLKKASEYGWFRPRERVY